MTTGDDATVQSMIQGTAPLARCTQGGDERGPKKVGATRLLALAQVNSTSVCVVYEPSVRAVPHALCKHQATQYCGRISSESTSLLLYRSIRSSLIRQKRGGSLVFGRAILKMRRADTVFALASAPGRSGVSVVRVSGPSATKAVTAILGRQTIPQPRQLAYRRILHPTSGELLDRGMVR